MGNKIALKQISKDDLDILVRFFEKNNLPEVTSKFNPFPLNRETAEKICQENHKDKFFMALMGDDVIGFSMLRGWDEGYEVPSFGMFVDYEKHGNGFGKTILKLTCEYAKKIGCSKVRLSVYQSNQSAYHVYKKFGFREIEKLNVNNEGRIETKLIMVKDLNQI